MRKLLFLVFCFTGLAAPRVLYGCDAQMVAAINWQRQDSVSEFLSACEREPRPDETRLFTWGHSHKLDLLTRHTYAEFYRYNAAQQDAYAGAQARRNIPELTGEGSAVARHEFLKGLRSVYGTATVGELYSFVGEPEYLLTIQNYWRQVSAPEGARVQPLAMPMDRNKSIDLRVLKQNTAEAQAGLEALALEQLHPGFLQDLEQDIDDLMDNIRTAIGDGRFPAIHPLEGKLLGLERAGKYQSKPSNVSFGPAVYFGTTVHGFVSHFYDGDHGGLVCTLDSQARIVDLTNPPEGSDGVRPQDVLFDNDVFLHSNRNPTRKVQFPTHYNELSNPVRFRDAARGRLIRQGHIYADNGVVRYTDPNYCRPIRITDFDTCAAVRGLLEEELFTGPNGQSQPLMDYMMAEARNAVVRDLGGLVPHEAVLEQQTRNELEQFRDRIADCVVNSPESGNVCSILASTGFQGSSYYQSADIRNALEPVINDHCH